jgi:hypothetical protein
MSRPRTVLPDALAAGLIGLAIFAWFGHAFLNYDTFYSLVWGSDLAHGRTPDYKVPFAPTTHPLAMVVGIPASLFGNAGEGIMLAIVILGLGFLVVGIFRLGSELLSWPIGLLAALIVLTRQPFLNYGIRGYVDLVVIALVVWSAVLEARRPRRGWPVLVLLGLAGLLRPEAWLYAGAYWLWLFPWFDWDQRLRYLALVLAAPLLWGFSDLLITGDFLWSLHGTHDLASELGRQTGLLNGFKLAPRRVGEIVRLPELIAAVIGLVFGLRWLRSQVALPAAIGLLNAAAFVLFGIAGLSLLTRYLFLAGAIVALFAAIGCLGWLELPARTRGRALWRGLGVVSLGAIVVFFGLQQVDRLSDLRTDIRNRDRVQDDLRSLANAPELRACHPVFVPNHRPVPLLAYWVDIRPNEILTRTPGARGSLILPANDEVQKLSILDPHEPVPLRLRAPAGYRLAERNRSWLLYAAGCNGRWKFVYPPTGGK